MSDRHICRVEEDVLRRIEFRGAVRFGAQIVASVLAEYTWTQSNQSPGFVRHGAAADGSIHGGRLSIQVRAIDTSVYRLIEDCGKNKSSEPQKSGSAPPARLASGLRRSAHTAESAPRKNHEAGGGQELKSTSPSLCPNTLATRSRVLRMSKDGCSKTPSPASPSDLNAQWSAAADVSTSPRRAAINYGAVGKVEVCKATIAIGGLVLMCTAAAFINYVIFGEVA